jgi:ketosteroid isomerase-like protein
MIKRSAVFSILSGALGAAVAAGVLSCDRRKESRERDEAAIRSRIEKLVEGIQAMDLVRILPIYAPEIVSFDIEPPLRHFGPEAKEKNWLRAFSVYQPPLGYEVRDLAISVGDDVAFAHSLAHVSGTTKNGTKSEYWVRWTTCLRKIEGEWLVVHDQISVPLDFQSGRAMLDLKP